MFRLLLVSILIFLGIGLVSVVMVPFVRHILGGSPEFYSLILTIQAASSIAAGAAVGRASRVATPVSLVAASLLVLGLLDLTAVAAANQIVFIATTALGGYPALLVSSNLMALFQGGAADAFRGRHVHHLDRVHVVMRLDDSDTAHRPHRDSSDVRCGSASVRGERSGSPYRGASRSWKHHSLARVASHQ
jgi:hypothetical protein